MICSSMIIVPRLLKIHRAKLFSRWIMLKCPNNGARLLPIFWHKNILEKQVYHNRMVQRAEKKAAGKWHIAWRIAGECGASATIILKAKTTHRYFMMSWFILYLTRHVYQTVLNGLIQDYTKYMASPANHRATIM